MKLVGYRRISNKDESRIKVGIDKFLPSFRACYVFFSSTTFLKLCLIRKRSTNGFSRNRTTHVRSSFKLNERTRSNSRIIQESPHPTRQKFDPLSLETSLLDALPGTGRRRGARGDRRNYHNHFSWLGKKNDARFQNINRHSTSGQHAA